MNEEAIILRVPTRYIINGKSVFDLVPEIELEELGKIYGVRESLMIWYHATEDYDPVASRWNGSHYTFMSDYDEWKNNYNDSMIEALRNFLTKEDLEASLATYPPYNSTPARVEKTYKRYTVSINNRLFDASELINIFDQIPLYDKIVAVMMIDGDSTMYKIKDIPQYYKVDYSRLFSKNTEEGIWIYHLIVPEPEKVNSYSVSNILKTSSSNEIVVETERNIEEIFDPENYTLEREQIVRISFSMKIDLPYPIVPSVWYYAVAVSPFLSQWLYLSEVTTVTSMMGNETPFISVTNPSNPDVTLGGFRMRDVENGVAISSSKNISFEAVQYISETLPKLLNWYFVHESSLKEEIKTLISIGSLDSEIKDYIATTKYSSLKARMPYLFIETDNPETNASRITFGTACQSMNQPIVVNEDEIPEMLLAAPNYGVFPPLPPEDSGIEPHPTPSQPYLCISEVSPYASLTRNLDPETSKQYPFIPCCAKSDRLSRLTQDFWKTYTATTAQSGVELVRGPVGSVLKEKYIDRMQLGKLPRDAGVVLSEIFGVPQTSLVRLGSGDISYNSVLSALLLLNDPEEWASGATVDDIRWNLFNNVNKQVIIQHHWYDEDLENTILKKRESNSAIDTFEWLSALEEAFNVNIYVFKKEDYDASDKEFSSRDVYELPLAKNFYIKKYAERDTVVLIKHSADSLVTYPTYDTVVYRSGGKIMPLRVLPGSTQRAYRIYDNYCQISLFDIQDGEWLKITKCIFNVIDIIEEELEVTLDGVAIDSFGKISYVVIEKNNTLFTLTVPPNASVTQYSKVYSINDLVYQPGSLIRETFPEAVETHFGAWSLSDLGVRYQYVSVLSDTLKPVTPSVGTFEEREAISIILEIIEYMWRSGSERDKSIPLEEWVPMYFSDSPGTGLRVDSMYLKEAYSTKDAVAYLSKSIHGLVDNGKINIGSESLIDSLIQYMRRRTKTFIQRKEYLTRNYYFSSSFAYSPNMRIFMNRDSFKQWNSSNSRNPIVYMNDRLKVCDRTYTYYSPKGSLYYVHPADSFKDAVAKSVAHQFKIPETRVSSKIHVMLYEIIENRLERVKRKVSQPPRDKPPPVFAQVLRYPAGYYAALEEIYRSE